MVISALSKICPTNFFSNCLFYGEFPGVLFNCSIVCKKDLAGKKITHDEVTEEVIATSSNIICFILKMKNF